MKKIFVFTVFCVLTFSLFAQAIFWEETFETAPLGWTLDSNWSFENGALFMNWSPSTVNYDLSAISPEISLPMNVGDLNLTQYIDEYSALDEMMEVGVIVEGTPSVIWQWDLTGGDWGVFGGESISISLADFAGQDVQLQFRSYGSDTWNINFWYIYDVQITALFDNDLCALEVFGPPNAEINKPDLWKVIVKNSGLLAQDSYSVKIFQEGGFELGSIDVQNTIEPLALSEHNFYWTPSFIEDTNLYGQVVLAGDEFDGNDASENHGVSIFPAGERQYLLWDHDNDSYYIDPNNGSIRDCEDGIEDALIANEITYQLVTELPEVLRNYNVVFATLGLYCVG
jgi:hypothetical protein